MGRESKRKRIRKAVEQLLKDSKIPNVGDDIFPYRSIPTEHENLPVILIYPKVENVDRFDECPKSYERILSIEIEIQSTHDTDALLADELDDLSEYVEDAIESSKDLSEMLNDLDLKSILYETESNGSSPIGSVRLSYDLQYYTDESLRSKDKAVAFKRMETTYKIEENEKAKEILDLPQEQ